MDHGLSDYGPVYSVLNESTGYRHRCLDRMITNRQGDDHQD